MNKGQDERYMVLMAAAGIALHALVSKRGMQAENVSHAWAIAEEFMAEADRRAVEKGLKL